MGVWLLRELAALPTTVTHLPASSSSLFRHVSADKAALYRAVLDTFAAAKRQFRLHLRPEEIRHDTNWPVAAPSLEELNALLDALVDWGNLEAQPDTARVSTLEDFYRRRLLYRLTSGGEAVETGLAAFAEALAQRGELQSVALDDILGRLGVLAALVAESPLDAAKVHEALRDLVHVFTSLAENAEAFMAGLARTIELQRADQEAVMAFKSRLIEYLERFIGDLVTKSSRISELLRSLSAHSERLLAAAAAREARDAAPGDSESEAEAQAQRLLAWRERWTGLLRWFVSHDNQPPQAELLRASARAAIPRLLQAVATLNERRVGRSDRAADFRQLAVWFASCSDDAEAHRLWRAAFALSPARHLGLTSTEEIAANTAWRDSPPITIHPRLRETGRLATRGGPPKIRDRSADRANLANRLGQEAAQTEAARRRLATGREARLSELGYLDHHSFRLFLALLGDALAAQTDPRRAVECTTGDGTLQVRLEPLGADTEATIPTEHGTFRGHDYRILIRRREEIGA